MSSFQEFATSPSSFRAAYNYNHSSFSSYAEFSSTNYKSFFNNNVVGSSFHSSGGSGGGGGLSSKTTSTKEVITFHSSAKWKAYFEASKQSNKLVVVYFTATWCKPCRSMDPIIKELAANHTDVDLVKIDVDELFNVSREYGVQTMPTFVFMKNGYEIDKVKGANKEDLQRKVEKHSA